MGPLYQEYRVIHGDGTVLWLEDIESFDHEEGNLILRGIARDITGRRTAEETLREVEVKYQHLFEQMPLGFILGQVINDEEGLPRDLRVLNANAAFTQQTGLHRDAIVGRTLLELYPGDATAWIDWYRQSAKAGNPVQFETFIGPLNRSHEISAFKISSDHLGLFFKDVTERNQAQALATATEGILAKGQMAAYVAHEINNPLAGIKSAFLLLENAIPQDHPYFHYIGLIHKEITRISIIVKSMYELYRPSSAVPTHILLRALLEEVTIFLAPKARAQQASIQLDLPDSELRVTIYSDLLRQILFNLIQNALDASSPNGTVLCRALRRNDRLCIQVIDGGSGIAPEVAARIFNPGFSTKQAMGGQMGLGLGLGSSRRLAEGLGGSLTFTNNPSEVGCTFELDLPLENQDIPQEPNHEP
jgi:signal transduction histidine kinase